jgi:c-di-GMP-related signal transduction protein
LSEEERVVVDGRRTLQPLEIELLIKIHRKRSMGWLIALDESIFNKSAKPKKPTNLEPYYDYVI